MHVCAAGGQCAETGAEECTGGPSLQKSVIAAQSHCGIASLQAGVAGTGAERCHEGPCSVIAGGRHGSGGGTGRLREAELLRLTAISVTQEDAMIIQS
jgi:hypothetical protein